MPHLTLSAICVHWYFLTHFPRPLFSFKINFLFCIKPLPSIQSPLNSYFNMKSKLKKKKKRAKLSVRYFKRLDCVISLCNLQSTTIMRSEWNGLSASHIRSNAHMPHSCSSFAQPLDQLLQQRATSACQRLQSWQQCSQYSAFDSNRCSIRLKLFNLID